MDSDYTVSLPLLTFYIFTGLVVAIMDHEHFRLKLLYKQKKKVSAELKTAKSELKGLEVSNVYKVQIL